MGVVMGLTCLLLAAALGGSYRYADLGKTPFPMDPIPEYVFPERTFNIADYGAKPDGSRSDAAIQKAIDACAAAGGGRVVVPAGTFYSAPIRLKSNVELHLEEDAKLEFTDNPADCLPVVMSSWEGLECMNYSPMVYVFGCTNVAITGRGVLEARMKGWSKYFRESGTGIQDARRILYTWGSEDYPVEKRDMPKAHSAVMRPQLLQVNRSKNVRIEGIELKDSPFWTCHLFMSENVVVRGLRTNCYGFNNDGLDIEMTRNVLVEDCVIRAGDDGLVFKAGRNRDAWRVSRPTENVIVRNVRIEDAVSLAAMGSELSGGIRNVWIHDCQVGEVSRVFYVKTNHRRGGFVDNILVEDIDVKSTYRLMAVETGVLYQWAVFPDYERRLTPITRLTMKDIRCRQARQGVFISGDPELPVDGVRIEDVTLERLQDAMSNIKNARNVVMERFTASETGTIDNRYCNDIPRMPNPTVEGAKDPPIRSHWQGKKVAVIDEFSSADAIAGKGTEYWDILAAQLGVDIWVYGVGDKGLGEVLADITRIRKDHWWEIDAIFIAAGSDDFALDVPRGDWYELSEEKVVRRGKEVRLPRRRLSMDAKTYRGRLNRMLETVKRTYPERQVVLMTPLHRGKSGTGADAIPDESYPNATGAYFDAYVEDVREAGRIWSVPVLDLYAETGFLPLYGEYARYFKDADEDMRHIGKIGHTRVAQVILRWMLSHPSDFPRPHDGASYR